MEMTFHRDRRISLIDYRQRFSQAPIEDMTNISTDDDPVPFLSAAAQAQVVFEDGLTVRELLLCLLPWRDTLSKATGIDIQAWVNGAERAGSSHQNKPRRALSQIEIFPEIWISPERRRARGPCAVRFILEKTTGLYRMAFPKARISDSYELSVTWQCLATYKTPVKDRHGHIDTHCGVSAPSIASWIDLPVILKPAARLIDMPAPRHMTWKGNFLDRRNPLLKKHGNVACIEVAHDLSTFSDVIIGAFLRDFLVFKTPAAANAFSRKTRSDMKHTDQEFKRVTRKLRKRA